MHASTGYQETECVEPSLVAHGVFDTKREPNDVYNKAALEGTAQSLGSGKA